MWSDRDLGLDAARGVAVLSMFVAHFAPGDGPGEILTLSEYLTAPLFVLLIGAGAELGKRSAGRFRANQVRFVVLVVLGLVLTQFPSGIVVVLVWLGFMILFATWMAALPTLALGAVGVAALVLEPILLRESTEWLVTHPADNITRAAVELTLNGASYRLLAMVLPACVGILLVRLAVSASTRYAAAAGALAVAMVLFVLDQAGTALLVPYSGTRQELVFSSALALGVTALVWALAPRLAPVGRVLAALGTVALTVYTAQVLGDWAYLKQNTNDDSWVALLVACVASVAFGLLWLPVAKRTGLRGPLEGPLDALARGKWPRL